MTTRRSTVRRLLVLTALASLGPAALGAAQPGPRDPTRLRARIEPVLATVHDLTVSIDEAGIVTLGGRVPSVWAKDQAIQRMIALNGVDSIVSTLTIARAESDAALAEAVADKVRSYVFYSIFDNVDVHVRDGFVTLIGHVRQGVGRRDVTDLVSRVHGVQGVDDRILELPAGDDRVRARIASRIYRHPQFQKYVFRRHPPIRIIVNQADVTLVGEVGSNLEKQLATHLALSVFGVLNVRNELRIARRTGD